MIGPSSGGGNVVWPRAIDSPWRVDRLGDQPDAHARRAARHCRVGRACTCTRMSASRFLARSPRFRGRPVLEAVDLGVGEPRADGGRGDDRHLVVGRQPVGQGGFDGRVVDGFGPGLVVFAGAEVGVGVRGVAAGPRLRRGRSARCVPGRRRRQFPWKRAVDEDGDARPMDAVVGPQESRSSGRRWFTSGASTNGGGGRSSAPARAAASRGHGMIRPSTGSGLRGVHACRRGVRLTTRSHSIAAARVIPTAAVAPR